MHAARAQELGFYISHVSPILSDLSRHKIVECLTTSQRRGKMFSLTKIGKELGKEVKNRTPAKLGFHHILLSAIPSDINKKSARAKICRDYAVTDGDAFSVEVENSNAN